MANFARYFLNGTSYSNPIPYGHDEGSYRDLLASKLPGFTWGGVLTEAVGGLLGGLTSHVTGRQDDPLPSPDVSVSFPGTTMPSETFPHTGAPYGRGRGGRWTYDRYGNLVWRKTRRMNVLNPRALKRSMRRVEGFAAFAKRTISFTKKVKMKKQRRKK